MIAFVLFPSSQNFHINIFTSNINGYPATKKRVVLAFMNYSLCWKLVVHKAAVRLATECLCFNEGNSTTVKLIKTVWPAQINKVEYIKI